MQNKMKYKIQKKHWWIEELENLENEEAYKWLIKQDKINKEIKDKEEQIIKAFEPKRKENLFIINENKKEIKKLKLKIFTLERTIEIKEKELNNIDKEINTCLAKIITGDIGKPLSQEARKSLNGIHIQQIKEANLLLTVKKLQMDGTNSQKKKSKGEQLTLVTN